MPSLRILFLDFDGVLNSAAYLRRWVISRRRATPSRKASALLMAATSKLDPQAVCRVNRIVEATDAKIVVCSSWRHYYPLAQLRRILRGRGLVGSVVGVTPAIVDVERGTECAAWLATHRRAAWSFAALDDDGDYEPMMDRLVQTKDGLRDKHVGATVARLQSPAGDQVAGWRARADRLMSGAVPIVPPRRPMEAGSAAQFVREAYAVHGYSNMVKVKPRP